MAILSKGAIVVKILQNVLMIYVAASLQYWNLAT